MDRCLIINADDLGICPAANQAAARALDRGILTSVSLMVCGPSWKDAVRQVLRPRPTLSVGVHLCLTSGRPLLSPTQVPLLVDQQGRFRHGFVGLWRLVRGRHRAAAVAQIRRELRAQTCALLEQGITIDHIDSHCHVHMIPGVFSAVAEIARTQGAYLRLADESFAAAGQTWRERPRRFRPGNVVKKWILSRLAAHAVRAEPDLPAHVDHYIGVLDSGRVTKDVLDRVIRQLPIGVTEVNCHPGTGLSPPADGLAASDRRFWLSAYRREELAALLDMGLRRRIEDHGIVLTNFRELARRQTGTCLRTA